MAAEKRPATVKIKCTSDRKPWADRPLSRDEIAEVDADVAKALIAAGFAEVAK